MLMIFPFSDMIIISMENKRSLITQKWLCINHLGLKYQNSLYFREYKVLHKESKDEFKDRLLNVLYSHIAFVWQFAIILNSVNIFCISILEIQSKIFDIIMENVRNLQLNYMCIQFPLIGAARLLHHFKPDTYLKFSGNVCEYIYQNN